MFSKLTVTNFFSIHEPVTLSLDHNYSPADIFKQNTLFTYYDDHKKRSILNGAIIYGANASGKTNVLLAFAFIRLLIAKSYTYTEKADFAITPNAFQFSPTKAPTSQFSVSFIEPNFQENEAIKFTYQLAINTTTLEIQEESLTYQKVLKTTLSKAITIFTRQKGRIPEKSTHLKKLFNKIEQENITYKSILSILIHDINKEYFHQEIESPAYKVVQCLATEITKGFQTKQFDGNSLEAFAEQINKDSGFKQEILETLYDFDFAIQDFSVTDMTDNLLESIEQATFSDDVKAQLIATTKKNRRFEISTAHIVDDVKYPLSMSMESDGTKKFLESSIRLFDALQHEILFISDEFDNKYHTKIQEGLLNKFIHQENERKAQFIIATHNPLLLNPDRFAKEQVIFIQKDRETQASEVFSLSEFHEITYDNHNWTNLYLDGRFGAVPEVF
ncbi:ATP-binding protein [Listeria weihenstephanensis]|uniref:ATP-binding protein n=1 Tax=Listeria weihenstephanensis TaxID=1006155 RepID=A0A841Z713_9LIST|nr:AAA family ATPase [Listeria weihenstephanensis]MBC1501075.1 ATP-binding protein [Listeria weihenstephanensis]